MEHAHSHPHKLSTFFATAIAGNDILSTVLYVSGIAALFAGIFAPLVLFAVVLVLFFYRAVYREVVGALPLNGGAYNTLLNGTSKTFAAVAGVMTTLSYTATAVISAKTAVEYLFRFLDRLLSQTGITFPFEAWIIPSVILILFVFALLVIGGVRDSARIAGGIFVFHIVTLTCFAFFGLLYVFLNGFGTWTVNAITTSSLIASHGGFLNTFFLAFSASMLGISGFESAANFVEEQRHGVFAKTLRNLAIGALIFNPLIAAVVLNILPLDQVAASKDFLLADAASSIGGMFLLGWIAIDAFFVLCGAVLTSMIGVSGLVYRMALDNCLPSELATKNAHGAHPRIMIGFFLLCMSILLITRGDLLSLAGVYTICFLSVMTFFAASNLVLRINRPDLKRPYRAPATFVAVALLSTLIGTMGNISIDPKNTGHFLTYFIPAITFVLTVIYRKRFYASLRRFFSGIHLLEEYFQRKYDHAADDRLVAFVHHVDRLYPILDYIHRNESGQNITLVHCRHGHTGRVHELNEVVKMMKTGGLFPNFRIKVEYVNKPFSPHTVTEYAHKKKIAKNKIFIGSIHHEHEFNYEDLGGVRVIL